MRRFALDDTVVHALATATPDPAGAATLRRARLNRTLLTLVGIGHRYPGRRHLLSVVSAAREAGPAAADVVLASPWVGVWAASCLRSGGDQHIGHLRNVAAACARRAAVVDPMPAPDRPAMLPTIGVLRPDGSLVPLREVGLGAGAARHHIRVDDLDPYRDCHGIRPAPRLSPREWHRWRTTLRAAWRLLHEHAPDWAGDLAAGHSTITPLPAGAGRRGMSVTHADAFGGFAAARPGTPAELAVMLVHEFQHSKLNAVTDVRPLLHDDADAEPGNARYFAPWRSDPRPLSGMIHGVTAFLAVADVWHRLQAEATLEAEATWQLATIRAQVARAADQIVHAPGLTAAGEQFVHGMATAAQNLLGISLPTAARRAADAELARLEQRWLRAIS